MLEVAHQRFVQLPFRWEVTVNRALAHAGMRRDHRDRKVVPVPTTGAVSELGGSCQDAFACFGHLGATHAVVIAAASPDWPEFTIVGC